MMIDDHYLLLMVYHKRSNGTVNIKTLLQEVLSQPMEEFVSLLTIFW